jgi:hypothetical protein
MLEITNNLRPKSNIPPYPNYHVGLYFEEYFFKRFSKEFLNLNVNDFEYIPIFWTNCYTNKTFNHEFYDIQIILDSLDKNKKYFTISQHDDCVYENLPENTIIFSMGGNKTGSNIIPIPLICSPINYEKKIKNLKISFTGSLTHPLRNKLYESYKNDNDFHFKIKEWELVTDKQNISCFMDNMSRSFFSLCPRGFGKTSFRLYESMQLDSIPIYVYDQKWLPWEDEIDWNNLIISISENEINNIKNKINNIDTEKMISYKNEIFQHFFTYDGVYNNIIKSLKKW